MKKQLAIATCCLVMSVSPVIAGCAPTNAKAAQSNEGIEASQSAKPSKKEAAQDSYRDGIYQGEGKGMGGPINVTLTITSGEITVDSLTETGETAGIGGKEAIADGTFKAEIESAQSADIDGVTGATMTTGGVKRAVEAALARAK